MSTLCIENLPNELWVKVFNYLDWINLFSAFYGLNQRINQLVKSTNILSIYSSYLLNYHDSIYIYFLEFPINSFQHIKHLRLIYDNEFDESLNLTKHFTLFSNLVSLYLEANCRWYGGSSDFQMFIYRQQFPHLRRLYLNGNVFDHDIHISYPEFQSNFPLLVYLNIGKLHINFALRILDEYHQLRSFSARIYCDTATDTITPFHTYLPALKELGFRGDTDFGNGFGIQFLKDFLPYCPNIQKLRIKVHCHEIWENFLEADWWSHILVSNKKLEKINFHLQWTTRRNFYNWGAGLERFRRSPFFTRLNANFQSKFHSEFMRLITVDIYIEN